MQFKYVSPVKAGEQVTSKSHNDLADAFNQRILSGVGDAAWRIVWNAHSLMRQVRNPSGTGDIPGAQQWPAADEWWKMYAIVDNATKCGNTLNQVWSWPTEPAGQEEGANVANPMMGFVFGRDGNIHSRDFEPEVNRLTTGPSDGSPSFDPIDIALLAGNEALDTLTTWETAKRQRGWIESAPPYRASTPVIEASHSAYSWRYGSTAPYLKTYSCFAPVPRDEGRCGAYNGIYPTKWTAVFTPLVPGYPELKFETCPGVSGHVQHIARLTDRYVLYVQDGAPITLPYTVYLEGPYDGGGALAKQHSELLTQALNKFIVEMRGNLGERQTCGYDVQNASFDFQRFFSTQFALSPASGGVYDELTHKVTGGSYLSYKLFTTKLSETFPAETKLSIVNGRTGDTTNTHVIPKSFVVSAFLLTSHNVLFSGSVQLVNDSGQVFHSETIPTSDGATIHRTVFLTYPIHGENLQVRLQQPATLIKNDGFINLEILEQVQYLPDIQDAYAVLRCAMTKGNPVDGDKVDAVGGTIDGATLTKFSTNYFKYGCIYNVNSQQKISYDGTAVNFNSIYESARELISQNLRMIPKDRVVQYEVNGGKSKLLFKRQMKKGTGNELQTIEKDVKPKTIVQVIQPASPSELRPYVEYVVRKKGGDNIKPVAVRDISYGGARQVVKLPVETYQDDINSTLYCDDYVLYANVKYVPPGYNSAFPPGFTQLPPSDAYDANAIYANFDHVIIGKNVPTVSGVPFGYLALATGTDVQVTTDYTYERTRSFVDQLGNARTEKIPAIRIGWKSITYRTGNKTPAFENMVMHSRSVAFENPADTSTFRYNNGYRYVVQRKVKTDGVWGDWVNVATGPSNDTTAVGTYGFSATTGEYVFEDPEAAGKTSADVEYRILAKPTLDLNNSKMVVYQRAYFTPRTITWTGEPGKRYSLKRTALGPLTDQGGVPYSIVAIVSSISSTTNNYTVVDPLTDICPYVVNEAGGYIAYETIDKYTLEESFPYADKSNLLTISISDYVVRPDNIKPTDPGDVFGDVARCLPSSSIKYKVYGPNEPGTGKSGISYVDPNNGSPITHEVYDGETFSWHAVAPTSAVTPCPNNASASNPCVDPWVLDTTKSFRSLKKIWKNEGAPSPDPATDVSTTAYIFQHGVYAIGHSPADDCATYQPIENTAGCEPGNFTGIFTDNTTPNLARLRALVKRNEAYYVPYLTQTQDPKPSDFNVTDDPAGWKYSDRFILTQWTPWSAKNVFTGSTYILRTGYERIYLDILLVPAPGKYTVRGIGFVTYKGGKYYNGSEIEFTNPLTYTVSDASTKLVTLSKVVCDSQAFDFFSGIAPAYDTSADQLKPGVTYRVHLGKGIKYQKKISDGAYAPTTVLHKGTFTWGLGDKELERLPAARPSQIRPVNGLRQVAPMLGESNTWCMFMSLNHYHTSVSSIWKESAYGDVMAFLHNRCHTYSSEIRSPQHSALVTQFSYGISPPVVSEAPPGYTYLENINRPNWQDREVDKNYYKSCQVYKAPYELEEVSIVYTESSGVVDADGNLPIDDSIVQVVLKDRLQHTEGAPSSVLSTNDGQDTIKNQLKAEPYRTDENALREFLLSPGVNCKTGMVGDSSTSLDIFTLPDGPFGCCQPRFYFVKLIPKVYEDGNSVRDPAMDSKITVDPYLQMDMYLRAMCGGWMDIDSLRTVNCDQGMSASPVADFLYENLCYRACRSAGTYTDVTPDVQEGRLFLPLQMIGEYSFEFNSALANKQLVLEYATWDAQTCSWRDWERLQGAIAAGATPIPVGGVNYGQATTTVTIEDGLWMNPASKEAATAVARIGSFKLTGFNITSGGSGYKTATVSLSGGGAVSQANATVEIIGGAVTAINLTDNTGVGYTSAPKVAIFGDGFGATATAVMTFDGTTTGPVGSIELLNPNTNFGYSQTPKVTITDATGTGAYAVARMQVLDMHSERGMRIASIDVIPAPSGNITTVSVPFEGPAFEPTRFRFSYASDWPKGVKKTNYTNIDSLVTTTSKVKLAFNFLNSSIDNPHNYIIYRNEISTASNCKMLPGWTAIYGGTGGLPGPACEKNAQHLQYDECTTDCACLFQDPTLTPITAPLPEKGLLYYLKDVNAVGGAGTVTTIGVVSQGTGYSPSTKVTVVGGGAESGSEAKATPTIDVDGKITAIEVSSHGSGYTQVPQVVIVDPEGTGHGAVAVADVNPKTKSYLLNWNMQPVVSYNVERKMCYVYESVDWEVLATNVRAPYIDSTPWNENFSQRIGVDVTKHQTTLTSIWTQGVYTFDNPPATDGKLDPRTLTIPSGIVPSNKNIYLNCTAVVYTDDTHATTTEYVLDPIQTWVEVGGAATNITDTRELPIWAPLIQKLKYSVNIISSVTLKWDTLKNHRLLSLDYEKSGLVYELHRKYEVDGTQNDEIIAQSHGTGTATTPDWMLNAADTTNTIDWSGATGKLLDSRLNNNFIQYDGPDNTGNVIGYRNTEEYYVVATWKDWPQTCFPCPKNASNVDVCSNRLYRVEAVVNARERWFTAMPMAVNIERPQGFSPVPNTCTYAEMFNNFARAINLLVYARLELPFTKKKRVVTAVSADTSTDVLCTSCNYTRRNICPQNTPIVKYGAWETVGVEESATATAFVGPTGSRLSGTDKTCDADMRIITSKVSVEFAVDPVQDCLNALPSLLRNNFNIGSLALIGRRTDLVSNRRLKRVYDQCAADNCCPVTGDPSVPLCHDVQGDTGVYRQFPCGNVLLEGVSGTRPYVRNEDIIVSKNEGQCMIFLAGTIAPPGLVCGDGAWLSLTAYPYPLCMSGASASSTTVSGIRSLVYMTFPLY